jgi:hypothetical protein
VQERDGAVELLLRRRTAGNWKVNLSKLFNCPLLCSSQRGIDKSYERHD